MFRGAKYVIQGQADQGCAKSMVTAAKRGVVWRRRGWLTLMMH